MATVKHTERLVLRPFGQRDFDHYLAEMSTSPRPEESHMYLYCLRPTDAAVP